MQMQCCGVLLCLIEVKSLFLNNFVLVVNNYFCWFVKSFFCTFNYSIKLRLVSSVLFCVLTLRTELCLGMDRNAHLEILHFIE